MTHVYHDTLAQFKAATSGVQVIRLNGVKDFFDIANWFEANLFGVAHNHETAAGCYLIAFEDKNDEFMFMLKYSEYVV
jgi:hypothetical protein